MNDIPGQTNIFDFIESDGEVKSKELNIGDNVRIDYYEDELEFINRCHPQLTGIGTIVNKKMDFFRVQIDDSFVWVQESKLIRI